MGADADNPYAAPRAPPERRPPLSWRVYLLAGSAGIAAFIGSGSLALLCCDAFVVVTDWCGLPVAERKIARYGILTLCVLIAAMLGVLAARRVLRQRTVRG